MNELARQDNSPVTITGDEVTLLSQRLRQELEQGYHWYQISKDVIDADDVARRLERILAEPVARLRWDDFATFAYHDSEGGLALWERIRETARAEVESGELAASAIESAYDTPLERARFLAIRESLAEGWQPRNGIEWALIDQMAQAYHQQMVWTSTLIQRSGEEAARDTREMEKRNGKEEDRHWRYGTWMPPRQSVAEAIETASAMVERWNRMFLRVLRQLRDLRRFTPPVIVNNGGQVNIAQQQVNQVGSGANEKV